MTSNLNDFDQQRRLFLQQGSLVLTTAAWASVTGVATAAQADSTAEKSAADPSARLRIGLLTDLHYADKAPAGTRYYRDTLAKLAEAGAHFERDRPEFLVELGDLIDAADSVDVERSYLKTIQREFTAIGKQRHYVLGNHCVDTLTKAEFLDGVGQEKSYYSFYRGGFHFVVLDACFRSDGVPYGRKNSHWTDANIPAAELEWLTADLQSNRLPTIVFAHQRLDVAGKHSVKNNDAVRQILESSGKVLAVFQGHSHQNDLQEIQGIRYCTLVAMVEGAGPASSGFSLLEIEPNGTLHLSGFRNQRAYHWDRQA